MMDDVGILCLINTPGKYIVTSYNREQGDRKQLKIYNFFRDDKLLVIINAVYMCQEFYLIF